jgi:predicted SprT family Zn-dependent metalloprotease
LVACAGRFHAVDDPSKTRIELSTQVCTTERIVASVLAHEMCHAAQYHIDGERYKKGTRRDMHGPSFRKWGEKATTEMGEDIDPVERCHRYNKGIQKKYKTRCTTCSQGSIQPSCVEV